MFKSKSFVLFVVIKIKVCYYSFIDIYNIYLLDFLISLLVFCFFILIFRILFFYFSNCVFLFFILPCTSVQGFFINNMCFRKILVVYSKMWYIIFVVYPLFSFNILWPAKQVFFYWIYTLILISRSFLNCLKYCYMIYSICSNKLCPILKIK